jgi:Optic atrophy 3 protein (OPA3)
MAPLVPFAKLAALAARQLAKPVSQILLRYTLTHPEARERTMAVGQILNRVNVRISRLAEGQRSSKQILELSDEKALDAGATFLGEVFIFSVGAALITQELVRANKKSWAIELEKQEEAAAKELQLSSQYFEANRRIQLLEESLQETRETLRLFLDDQKLPLKSQPSAAETSNPSRDKGPLELERLLRSSLSSIDTI